MLESICTCSLVWLYQKSSSSLVIRIQKSTNNTHVHRQWGGKFCSSHFIVLTAFWCEIATPPSQRLTVLIGTVDCWYDDDQEDAENNDKDKPALNAQLFITD